MTSEEKYQADFDKILCDNIMRQSDEYNAASHLIYQLARTSSEQRKLEIAQELIALGDASSLAQADTLARAARDKAFRERYGHNGFWQ